MILYKEKGLKLLNNTFMFNGISQFIQLIKYIYELYNSYNFIQI